MTTFNSGFGQVFLYAYFIGMYAAPVLMGYALWRSRSVPRWLAVLFIIGLELAEQQSSAGLIVVLYMLPFAVAMVLLAARIWQAAALPARPPPGAGRRTREQHLETSRQAIYHSLDKLIFGRGIEDHQSPLGRISQCHLAKVDHGSPGCGGAGCCGCWPA